MRNLHQGEIPFQRLKINREIKTQPLVLVFTLFSAPASLCLISSQTLILSLSLLLLLLRLLQSSPTHRTADTGEPTPSYTSQPSVILICVHGNIIPGSSELPTQPWQQVPVRMREICVETSIRQKEGDKGDKGVSE